MARTKLRTVSINSKDLIAEELRILSNVIAEKTAAELEEYPGQAESHFRNIKEILIKEGSDFKN